MLKLYLIYSTVVTNKINTQQEEAISHHWIHGTVMSLLICKLVDEKAKLRQNDHGRQFRDKGRLLASLAEEFVETGTEPPKDRHPVRIEQEIECRILNDNNNITIMKAKSKQVK